MILPVLGLLVGVAVGMLSPITVPLAYAKLSSVALLASLGLNAYRFSLEWSRIEPAPGEFSAVAIAHYRDMLRACHEYGLTPIVTYHHFTSPTWLIARGGWEDKATPGLFARYCRRVTAELGDLFEIACTMNEPNLAILLGEMGLCEAAPEAPETLARALRERADWALREVPSLAGDVPGLGAAVEALLAELASLEALEPACRVHGDYHLGQVLHEIGGGERWYVLDFEGEPLRPLAERSRPDQPARDVAGMLRSFDYAWAVGGADSTDGANGTNNSDWLPAVRAAFLGGYRAEATAGAREDRPGAQAPAQRQSVLLAALELDKALYEAVYEARNRPDWLAIPLRGLAGIVTARQRDHGADNSAGDRASHCDGGA